MPGEHVKGAKLSCSNIITYIHFLFLFGYSLYEVNVFFNELPNTPTEADHNIESLRVRGEETFCFFET